MTKPSPPLRLAFLGVDHPHGAGWRQLLELFRDEVEIAAYVPGFGGATASLEERYVGAKRCDTLDELIAWGQFDAAVVCLPNNESPAAVVELANAGKHILAEKPVAGTARDAEAIVQAVEHSGVAYQNGYMWRYDDGANRLRDMVRDGRFGKLIGVETLFVTSDVKRRDPGHYLFDPAISTGGFFNWLACHCLDLLTYILDQPVVGVTARTGVFGTTPVEVEDGGAAILDLAGGGLATFVGGYWIPRWEGEHRWSFRGSERWVHWDPVRAGTSGVLEIHGPKPQWNAMDEVFTIPADTTPGYGGRRGVALVRDWLDAIREGGRACRNTPRTTLQTLKILDAIDRASREGRRVELNS